ncbi:glutathione S-transferase family protein [Myxococcus sp. MISCRS1]|uniref:glutathione S-transferase family protein n=1 Tax=Myxococcus TaxID=32 RepID=UPI001CC0EACB|nr:MULTISPECIES: glutathione S-transferase family protein [unclassified Myxococcus]MBZ4399705.1 glutathione S-transferase family protein [Myxococcus sp. AS-1-15]MBZ4409769.1 glutathione S-transferase family protein [Myxococcus sp. XM-1-1-1]MCY0997797.1 glutathione S-transferase family protein [Myxococcus sp. MISCRS1]BDT32182.1 glutathione S-transferase family protein [Myxococcus sp. MH1]
MKLYFHPMSGNSRRVLLVATHLDVPLERVMVDLPKGEQRAASHLGRNPNGLVPVLDDDGFLLWESRAIMQYLVELTPGQTLLPTEARGRADVSRWLFWCSAHMAPACTILVQENFVKAMTGRGPPDPAEVARGEALFAKYARLLDEHLAGKTWVSQERLTLADFSLAAGFALAGPARLPLGDFPNVRTWLGRVQELEAWKRTAPTLPLPARG